MQRAALFLVFSCLVGLVGLVGLACSKDKPVETTTTGAQPMAKPVESAAPVLAPPVVAGQPAVVFKEGIATPESVLYDADADEYVVSNIDGDPLKVDGNGYIMRLSPDGKVTKPKWIEKLDAPKGLAIARDNLYVTDISRVRIFDKKTGAPKGEVKIPGGTFVNDVTVAPDGRILVSDTGTTGNDGVYAIEKDDKTLTTIAKSKDLGGPNGLLPIGDKIWVAGYKSGELYSLDAKGVRGDAQKLPKGSLDGILALPNGDLLVSSWEAKAVFRGKPGGTFAPVIEGVKSPADIGFDAKRSRVLVPLFEVNEVRAYDVK